MRIIAYLYFLLAAFAADARLIAPTPTAFPSLPAAVHREDSADVWRRGLGAAKTGGPRRAADTAALPSLYAAADFFRMKFKHTDSTHSHYLRGAHKNILKMQGL